MPTLPVTLPRQLPLAQESQVLVVGGGPGGIGAAVAAARQGADVLLVEHYGFLGGMASAGEVNPFMPNNLKGKPLDAGIYTEWRDRMATYGGTDGGDTFDPNCARLAAEDLCLEAGVRLLYHHRAVHVERTGRRIDAVVLHSKSGLYLAKAANYIDSTGDGDLAALAGCTFEFGGASGHCQPMTLCFKLKLDPQDVPAEQRDDPHRALRQIMPQIQELWKQAQADGRVECPRENVLLFRGVDRGVVHFNTTRVIHRNATQGAELSDAEIQARRQLRQIFALLKSAVPLFAHASIYSIAPQIGVRESRRILGRNYVTAADYEAGRTFPDAVARVTYPIDIHNPDGTGTVLKHLPPGRWYEIPFGCLLPREVDNLAVGSRCISVDHAVHSSVRVMPPVCSLGQAAGTAAAMATAAKIDVSQVDGLALRQNLIAQGRNLVDDAVPAAPSTEPLRTPRNKTTSLSA
jgi:glycine/D-amino acid oxidase-like deaminating enzyme